MNLLPNTIRTIFSAGISALYFYSAGPHASNLDISQSPLMLVDSVAPNLIFTLDDSGSMEFAYAPDGLSDKNFKVNGVTVCPDNSQGCRGTRRAKSSDFNPLYYNPDVNYIVPKKADGSSYSTSFTSAPWNGFTGADKINLSTSYMPVWNNDWSGGTKYARHPSSSGFHDRDEGTTAYYYVYDKSRSGCSGAKHDDSCYEKVEPDTSDDKQNFANWYSFYRTRGLATLSAAHLAFYELPSSVRFSWQRINQSSSPLSSNFSVYSNDHKTDFFKWMKDNSSFNGSTPLRRAMKRAGVFLTSDKAWQNEIGTSNSGKYSCRPAYHVMMADGIWNGDKPSDPSSYKHDDKSWSTPDGINYSPKAPYEGDADDTLADLAMHYWATDLHPIDNDVKPFIKYSDASQDTEYWDPRNNPATWQHMVNFTVGLGLTGSLVESNLAWDASNGTFDSSGYKNIANGSEEWPNVSSNNGKVYDLWHAAINSRGEFFSADSPESLVKSFKDILNRIAERTSTAAAAGSTTSVSADDPDDPYNLTILNRAFFPEYNSEDWSGDVKRYDIKRLPNGGSKRELKWSAKSLLTSAEDRNIKMSGGNSDSSLRDFDYENLSDEVKALFDMDPDATGAVTDNKGSNRVRYLRGARDAEGSSATNFRIRSSVLGDIINSTPVVVGAPSYLPYIADKIDGSAGKYLTFFNDNQSRPELVYVGANDGMLHVFSAVNGKEVFAFVPSAVLKHMPKLTGQTYKGGAHRFFVDGSPTIRDVYFDSAWHTVLVGTLGAGGKSLFALDITNPGEDGSGIKLLWEITNESKGYSNLGYSFPEPEIVRLHGGQWAVLQGNGYDSEKDAASLLIINIKDGALIKELVVDNGETENSANGLSSVRGADNNGDGIVDYAYAGDLKGNLWRFDLVKPVGKEVADPFSKAEQTSVTASDYKISYGDSPLYRATYPIEANQTRIQAITSPPSLVRHPTRRGYIVMFGTGKYVENSDAAPDVTKANSVYGVWDRLTKAQPTVSSDAGSLTRSNLQQQTIQEQKSTTFTGEVSVERTVRYISDNPVQWYISGTTPAEESDKKKVLKWGWYVDLQVGSKQGEMMVDRMVARGNTLLFGTLTPSADPCADGAVYWAYGINAHTGARTKHPTFDFNQDGSFDSKDSDQGKAPSSYESDSPITLTRDGSVIDIKGSVGFATSPELQGRQSWQTIPLEIEE
ncbi:pilus assembly protein [Pseudomonas sp. OIL-1]|uniref:pilus assembly protein n=1 Tax=Pseudomonas sp. OIL-1 TaxID=2706126 RepID=UPI0013A753D1|nr:PilC/PilY family type IV pilus protein [Pseudomonas sp. OIL-1]QIB49637.1 pilus assembly protein PilY [Pseudomonas sp. OIL-1]